MPVATEVMSKKEEKNRLHQAQWEAVMFDGSYRNEYERLRALARAFRQKKFTKQWFVSGIMECFRDDHGMDWQDDFESLNLLAKVLSDHESVHSLVIPTEKP